MKLTRDKAAIELRLKLLHEFLDASRRWLKGDYDQKEGEELRSLINKRLIAARRAVREAGTLQRMTIGPPPIVGGIVPENIDPFQNFFIEFWGMSVVPQVINAVEQAIGVYEIMQSDPSLLGSTEAIDVETAIERALRPRFRQGPPNAEVEVQDAIEDILNALGVEFSRDRETVSVGGKAFRPDFVLSPIDLAIEAKLSRKGRGEAKIQEEINADISAYRTRWRHILFVVYDNGVIKDPHRLRQDNLRLFGVSVVVVKH